MPKSKRAKLVSLTKVTSNRKELKRDLADNVRECVDRFAYVYVFDFENLRTAKFKDVRAALADSRFFLGKNRVMSKALGDDEEHEYRPQLHLLAGELVGQVGLLFSNRAPDDILRFVDSYAEPDYARAGFVPSETITVPAGPLTDFPHTLNDTFRKLGMPVRLDKGTIILTDTFSLCKAGEPLSPEQGRLLQLFGKQLAVFRFHVVAHWHNGVFTPLRTGVRLPSDRAASAAAGGADDVDAIDEE